MDLLGQHDGLIIVMVQGLLATALALVGGMIDLAIVARPGNCFVSSK